MSVSNRRVRAIFRKELREYRRNRTIVTGMAILPLLFLVQPLVAVLNLGASASGGLAHENELLYLLAIPALVPATLAAYSVVGERQQGTLEPVLGTPIRREEFLLGKALAPSSRRLRSPTWSTPSSWPWSRSCTARHRAGCCGARTCSPSWCSPRCWPWSIWVGIAISTRSSEVRVAEQLGILANLPSVVVTSLIAFNVIHPSLVLALGAAVVLLVLNELGWRSRRRCSTANDSSPALDDETRSPSVPHRPIGEGHLRIGSRHWPALRRVGEPASDVIDRVISGPNCIEIDFDPSRVISAHSVVATDVLYAVTRHARFGDLKLFEPKQCVRL